MDAGTAAAVGLPSTILVVLGWSLKAHFDAMKSAMRDLKEEVRELREGMHALTVESARTQEQLRHVKVIAYSAHAPNDPEVWEETKTEIPIVRGPK